MVLKDDDLIKIFGIPDEKKLKQHIKTYVVPQKWRNSIPAFKKQVNITMHVWMWDSFSKAIEYICDNGLGSLIKEWGGAYNIRKIRGLENEWSIHSWALAFDINMSTNGLGEEPQLDARIVAVFKDNNFDWGGDWKRKDGMHFQLTTKKVGELFILNKGK